MNNRMTFDLSEQLNGHLYENKEQESLNNIYIHNDFIFKFNNSFFRYHN